MAAKRKSKKYANLEKRTSNSSWFMDVSLVPSIRQFYDGKSRLRHSLGTKDLKRAISKRNEILREIEGRRAVAELSDFNDQDSPSVAYTKALEAYRNEPTEVLEELEDQYELEHNLHSASKQQPKDHPAYFAMRQLQTNGKHREEFSATLSEVLDMFLAKRIDLSESSVSSYKVAVNVYGPSTIVSTITRADVNLTVDGIEGSKASIKSKLSCLSMLVEYSRNRGMFDEDARNPFDGIDLSDRKAVEKTPIMTNELLRHIYSICPERHRDFLRVLSMTGCRGGELANLERCEIDGDPFYRVLHSKTKAGVRVIPIHQSILDVDITRLPKSSVVAKWLNNTRKKGLLKGHNEETGLHGCRTAFVTQLKNKFVDHVIVAELAGHSSSNITDRYYAGAEMKALTAAIGLLESPLESS
jgi:integrase